MLIDAPRPSRWIATIMLAWGIVMTCMGVVQSYGGLLAARFFLGITEVSCRVLDEETFDADHGIGRILSRSNVPVGSLGCM